MNPDDFADRWAANQERRYQDGLAAADEQDELNDQLASFFKKSIMKGDLEETYPYIGGYASVGEILVDHFEVEYTYEEMLTSVIFAPSKESWVDRATEKYREVLEKIS